MLFGKQFRRDRSEKTINALLNYSYTIIRSAMARAVISSGLHPTFSLHHKSEVNAFRLIDDLIEPCRILSDQIVYARHKHQSVKLDTKVKRCLAAVVDAEHLGEENNQSIFLHMQRKCNALVQILDNKNATLRAPNLFNDMEMLKS